MQPTTGIRPDVLAAKIRGKGFPCARESLPAFRDTLSVIFGGDLDPLAIATTHADAASGLFVYAAATSAAAVAGRD